MKCLLWIYLFKLKSTKIQKCVGSYFDKSKISYIYEQLYHALVARHNTDKLKITNAVEGIVIREAFYENRELFSRAPIW